MIKVIERATGTEFKAKKIEGGYEVYTLEDEKYKKLKDSTFKKYFKLTGEAAEEPKKEKKKTSKKATKKAEPVHEELSDDKKAKMIDKIRKMLALAKDNPSLEEGLSAALQAQKLMMKYNIHEDDVTLEEIRDEISSVFSEQKHNSHLLAWRKQLALIVANNFRCKTYIQNSDIVFRGYTQDAKIALDVYLNLYTIGNKLAGQAYAEQKAETGSGKGAYNSFVLGFMKGIQEGLGEQSTALMVIVPKEVEEEFEEYSKDFKTSRGMNVDGVNSKTYEKGKREGKAAVKSRQVEKKGK